MTMKVGILGTGAIAPAYITGCSQFPEDLQIVACADLDSEKARAFADTHHLEHLSIDEFLGRADLNLIINLTIPAAHAEVNHKIIAAGKHVYVEKPLGLRREQGQVVLEAADAQGVQVGCAPDTFLGAGGQTARRAIDQGLIGEPVAATAFFTSHGPEPWHPNPFFYYQPGGGPMFDMGPYYLTALVNLLGSMDSVAAMTSRSSEPRAAGHESIRGQAIPVDIETHFAGTIAFTSGVIANVIATFDFWPNQLPRLEIYGTEGTLHAPDPNRFDGEVQLWSQKSQKWQKIAPVGRVDVERGIGVADMARAIPRGEPFRASGELAYHVLDAMQAFEESSAQGRHIRLGSRAERPEAVR